MNAITPDQTTQFVASSRGPASRRGLQFSDTTLTELLETLAKIKARMRLVDGLLRSSTTEAALVEGDVQMTRAQLTTLRREMVTLQSDLRAELRRRGEM
ncbi:MAG TPA: hypothetical protein VJP84_17820 [Steroidobacteraceae bacterium]|jgi:hypothetical protein|nr:hypothetical protein [Steroidobacteraceae bacterium]